MSHPASTPPSVETSHTRVAEQAQRPPNRRTRFTTASKASRRRLGDKTSNSESEQGSGCAHRLALQQPRRSLELDVDALLHNLPRYLSDGQVARLLWTDSYAQIFVATLQQFAAVSEPLLELFESSRRAHVPLIDDRRAMLRFVGMAAGLAREQSVKVMPLPVVIKAISWLMQRTPTRVWRCEQLERRIIHKEVAVRILSAMMECRPGPRFEVQPIALYVVVSLSYRLCFISDRIQLCGRWCRS